MLARKTNEVDFVFTTEEQVNYCIYIVLSAENFANDEIVQFYTRTSDTKQETPAMPKSKKFELNIPKLPPYQDDEMELDIRRKANSEKTHMKSA